MKYISLNIIIILLLASFAYSQVYDSFPRITTDGLYYRDTFESYNASYNISNNYEWLGNWTYNTNMDNNYSGITAGLTYSDNNGIPITYYLNFTYNISNLAKYYIIVKMATMADFGTDICGFQILGDSGNMGLFHNARNTRFFNGSQWSEPINNVVGQYYYYLIIADKNLGTFTMWISSDLTDIANNWIKKYEGTYAPLINMTVFQLYGRNAQCNFDNILITELINYDIAANTRIYPTFIYNANSTIENLTIEWIKDNNITYTDIYSNYSDFANYSRILDWGNYEINVTFCDILGNCIEEDSNNLNLGLADIQLHIFNESDTGKYITDTLTVDLLNDGLGYYNQTTTSIGRINYTDIPMGDFEIRYYGTDYALRSYYDELALSDTKTVTVYALKTTNYLDVYIQDFTLAGISNASITIQKWDNTIGAGITIAQGKTNNEGLRRFYINTDDTFYKFVVSYGGSVIYTSDWEIVTGNTYRITTDISSLYTQWPDLDGELILQNTTLPYYFAVTYANKDGDIWVVCLRTVISRNGQSGIQYNHTCLSTTSGTIEHKINENQSYTSYAYYVLNDGDIIPLADIHYTKLTALQEDFKSFGLLISIILSIVLVIGILVMTKNLIACIVALDLVILAIWYLGLFPFSDWSLGIILPGSIIIMYYLNKAA